MRPIPFAPGYFVSDEGAVFSERSGSRRRLKPWRMKGYPMVSLRIEAATVKLLVHRLVGLVFMGPPPSPRHEVRHLDGNPANPILSNLEWGTHVENMADMMRHGRHGLRNNPARAARGERHGSKLHPESVPRGEAVAVAKLSAPQVVEIRRRAIAGERQAALAREFGVTATAAMNIIKRRTWKHVA